MVPKHFCYIKWNLSIPTSCIIRNISLVPWCIGFDWFHYTTISHRHSWNIVQVYEAGLNNQPCDIVPTPYRSRPFIGAFICIYKCRMFPWMRNCVEITKNANRFGDVMLSVECPSANYKKLAYRSNHIEDCSIEWVSGWLLFNTNSAIFQLIHAENKLIFKEMVMRSALY